MKSCLVLVLWFVSSLALAQNEDGSEYDENFEFPESKTVNISIGLGLGLDYGGIGGKLTFVPTPRVALFGGIGYNFNGAGYNGGLIVRLKPEGKVCPYLTGMYGYNGVIVVDGMSEVNKTYYGATLGGGIELHRNEKTNFWNFGMGFPLRSEEYKNDLEALKNNPSIEFLNEPLPFVISVGYHFGL
jgi:hypothetical protein